MMTFNTGGSFSFVRGDDLRIPLAFSAGGVATNLTGYTFLAQIRSKPNGYIVLQLTVDNTDAATGKIVLSASHTDTSAIRLEEAVWDLQQTAPDGTVTTIIGPADVTIIKDVSL